MTATSASDLARIQRLSSVCALACGALAVGVPVFACGLWALAPMDYLRESHLLPALDPAWVFPKGLQPWQRLTGAALSLIPATLLSYSLLGARRALAAFARGDFFAATVGAGLKTYAAALFWSMVASLLLTPVSSVALTFANPPGHRELTLGLSSGHIAELVSAGILWTIAAVMVRASAIARENEQFV